MSHSHLIDHLTEAVFAAKQKALSHLIRELMTILSQQNYTFDQLIDALADYAESQPNHGEVVGFLEQACQEASKVGRPENPLSDRQ